MRNKSLEDMKRIDPMWSRIEIVLTDGKWLINGKQYSELNFSERIFFDEFLIALRLEVQSKSN